MKRSAFVSRRIAFEIAILLLLAGLPALFFWPLLSTNPSDVSRLAPGDFTDLHYPYRIFVARELAEGRLPLWNPYVSAGHSSLGDIQFDIFYPPTLAFSRWFGADLTARALQMQVVLHFALAGVFTYLFARRALAGRFAGLIAALCFTYGGYLTSFPVQQIIILQVSVWLPLILLFLDIGVKRASPACFALAGLALAMAALAGHPQTLGYVCVGAAAYLVYRIWRLARAASALEGDVAFAEGLPSADEEGASSPAGGPFQKRLLPRRLWVALLGSVLFVVVGFGAAAIQLVPALEHLSLTTRTDVSYAFTSSGFDLRSLTELALPVYHGGNPLYVGIPTLLLASVGLVQGRSWPGRVFWGGLGLASLLVSFGGHTFLRGAFYTLVPGMQFFRNHERTAFLFALAVAMLAGYGAHRLAGDRGEEWRSALSGLLRPLFWLSLVAVGLAMLFLYGSFTAAEADRSWLREVSDRAFFTALLVWLTIALLRWRGQAGVSVPIWKALFVALLVFDLFSTSWQFNLRPGDPEAPFAPPASVQTIMRDRSGLFRIASEGLLPGDGNAGSLYGIYDVVGNSPLEVERYSRLSSKVEEWQRWRLLNVKYILTKREFKDDRFTQLSDENGVRLYELKAEHRVPRAYVVHRVRYASSPAEALDLTKIVDPKREVVIEAKSEPSLAPAQPVGSESEVTVIQYDPQRISIDAKLAAPGWLVLSEVYYPGWEASVDGRPAEVLRADYTLRAVRLEAGRHTVELRYAPRSLALGREITLGALALAITVMLVEALARFTSVFEERTQPRPPGLEPADA